MWLHSNMDGKKKLIYLVERQSHHELIVLCDCLNGCVSLRIYQKKQHI